jgi:protein-tyrosine phosphatase
MFKLFNRKVHFIDIWSGTPDIHCHVLPGIDDGATSVDERMAIFNEYKNLGCPAVIATPQIMEGIYDNTRETIFAAHKLIEENNCELELKIGAEYMLDGHFDKLLDEEELLSLRNRDVLIEMSYFQPPVHLKSVLFKIISQQYQPILAHPERYSYYHNNLKELLVLKKSGCKFQLNALSLSGHYGAKVKEVALKLLINGTYDFIGSDAHRLEHLTKLRTIQISQKYIASLKTVCSNTKVLLGS